MVSELSVWFLDQVCASTCVLSEFRLVRAMWLLDLLVLLIVCLLGLLLGSWYLYMKLMMKQHLCHQQGLEPQSMKKSTRNSGTQTEWDQMSLFLTHHGRVLHQEHCQYLGNNRAKCRELHLCQICFHRWFVDDSTRPRFLQRAEKYAAWLLHVPWMILGLITREVVEDRNFQVTVLSPLRFRSQTSTVVQTCWNQGLKRSFQICLFGILLDDPNLVDWDSHGP